MIPPKQFFLMRQTKGQREKRVCLSVSRARTDVAHTLCVPDGPASYPDRFLSSVFYASTYTPRFFFIHRKGADFLRNPTPSSVLRLIWSIKKNFFVPGQYGLH